MGFEQIPIPGHVIDVGARDNLKTLIGSQVRQLMRDILNDRLFHAEVVAAGRSNWRRGFEKQFGALYDGNRTFCDELADTVFQFCASQWRLLYQTAGRPAYDGLSPAQLLDKVEMVSPPTEREIEDSWELEIAGSEAALRQHYDGSARIRKGRDLGAKTVKPERD